MGNGIVAENRNAENLISGASEGYMFLEIYKAIFPLITNDGILIDIGHGKNLQFPVRLAQTIIKYFPGKEMVYYDSSDPDIVRGWFASVRNQLKRRVKKKTAELVIKAKKISGEIPELIRWIDSPGKYLGKGSEACFFFTRHHFSDSYEALREAHSLLKSESEEGPGGVVVVIDYDLKSQIKGMTREQADEYVRSRFITQSELEVIRTEPDWFEAHTREGLAECVRDMTNAGFNVIEREVYDNKVFSCVGRKVR